MESWGCSWECVERPVACLKPLFRYDADHDRGLITSDHRHQGHRYETHRHFRHRDLSAFLARLRTGGHATVASKENPAKTNKYVLKIQGPAGAKFDMLLITKPTERENPTRETATVVVPFSKDFEATSCYAWFDTLPDGASGKVGDQFEVLFIVNGHSSATAELTIQPRNKQTAGLGDL